MLLRFRVKPKSPIGNHSTKHTLHDSLHLDREKLSASDPTLIHWAAKTEWLGRPGGRRRHAALHAPTLVRFLPLILHVLSRNHSVENFLAVPSRLPTWGLSRCEVPSSKPVLHPSHDGDAPVRLSCHPASREGFGVTQAVVT